MNREEALSLLKAKLDEYRKLSYDQLAQRVGDEAFPEVTGPSGAQHQMEIQLVWNNKPNGDVRLLGSIDDGGWRAFMPLSADLILKANREANFYLFHAALQRAREWWTVRPRTTRVGKFKPRNRVWSAAGCCE